MNKYKVTASIKVGDLQDLKKMIIEADDFNSVISRVTGGFIHSNLKWSPDATSFTLKIELVERKAVRRTWSRIARPKGARPNK